MSARAAVVIVAVFGVVIVSVANTVADVVSWVWGLL